MYPKLGINLDHTATLRQAGGETYPSIVEAASVCLSEGADQISIHLCQDRRHIQDTDVQAIRLVTKKFGKPLALKMGPFQEILDVAVATRPDWIYFVPENRFNNRTPKGLNLLDQKIFDEIKIISTKLRNEIPGIKISISVEAKEELLKRALQVDPHAVEINTGDYAKAILNQDIYSHYIHQFSKAKEYLSQNNIECHAGHGLTYNSLIPLLEINVFDLFNIGHWIICQALFDGIGNVIKKIKKLL